MEPIKTKDELILALKDAAELEQQFMCMYLYAAFSLKKDPDGSCTEAELEAVRRWASKVYMIARQEMEHLSLVNSMLAAIGAAPHFARNNVPAQSPHFTAKVLMARQLLAANEAAANDADAKNAAAGDLPEPCDLPFVFEPFTVKSARRYACMESAELIHLSGKERETVLRWCYKDEKGNCNCVSTGPDKSRLSLHRTHALKATKLAAANSEDKDVVHVGTIEEWYDRIKEGFITLSNDPNVSLFVGACEERQVDILSEYNIYIFPVTDLVSACNAIDLITKQGEGLGAAPGYDSHFLNFYEIAEEFERMNAQSKSFDPAYALPYNPTGGDITDPLAKEIFDLFNYSYVTLLYMLTGLYGWYKPPAVEGYPHISASLRELAFAPGMTMMIRSLGEVLVQLPSGKKAHERAAPNFYIDPHDDDKLQFKGIKNWEDAPDFNDIEFYLHRFGVIEERLVKAFEEMNPPENIAESLRYIAQNVCRMTGNLRRIYQTGVYSLFRTVS